MWLDADDVVPEKSVKEINELKKTLSDDVEILTMKYVLSFDQNNNPIFYSIRERLFKRSKNYQWIDPVHEYVPLIGNLHYTDIEIWHKKTKIEMVSIRNLTIYESLEMTGKVFTPRQLYYYARELRDHGKSQKAMIYYEKFLESEQGWFKDVITCCYDLAVCYKNIGSRDRILSTLLKSFEYDSPRASICCEIGYYYKDEKKFDIALRWFDLATGLIESTSVGFVHADYTGYIPNVEACVCLCFLGDYEKANEYNEKAAFYRPGYPSVMQNREYLKIMLSN